MAVSQAAERKFGEGRGRAARACALTLATLALGGWQRIPTDAELLPPSEWLGRLDWDRARSETDRRARLAADRTLDFLRNRPPPPQTAPALARAIRYSRDLALRKGARRAPPHVRRALAPYFSPAVLEEVRWTLPRGRINAGTVLVGWYFREGAMTLEDVVVFSDDDLAANVWFWAHELAHVEQFRRLGVDGFARRYVADWRSLEREATDRANRVTADIRARRRTAGFRP